MNENSQILIIDESSTNLVNISDYSIFKNAITIESTKKTSAFLGNLCNEFSKNEDDILPKNCRIAKKLTSTMSMFVIEDQPKIRSISTNIDMRRDMYELDDYGLLESYGIQKENIEKLTPPYRFQLSFPYVIYVIISYHSKEKYFLKKCHIFYRLSSLKSNFDYLLIPNLPNIGSNCYLCTGNLEKKDGYDTYEELCDDVICNFWNSDFNHDLYDNVRLYEKIDMRIKNYLHWQYHTLNDPFFINEIKWMQSHQTIFNIELTYSNHSYEYNNDTENLNFLSSLIKDMKSKNISDKIELRSRFLYDTYIKNYFISSGDIIKIDDKIYTIDSFIISNQKTNHAIDRIILIDENDEYIDMMFDVEIENKIIKYLKSEENKNNIQEIKIEDLIFKVKDVIQYGGNYFYIKRINNNHDKNSELIISNGTTINSILLNNENLKKIKQISEFKFNNINLEIDKEYVISKDAYPTIMYRLLKSNKIVVKYKGCRISNCDIYYTFLQRNDDKSYSDDSEIDYHHTEYLSIRELDEENLNNNMVVHDLICINKKLYINNDKLVLDDLDYTFSAKLSEIKEFLNDSLSAHKFDDYIFDANPDVDYDDYNSKQMYAAKSIKSLKYFSLFAKTEININIGDQVVVSDWRNPEEMLKIKKIKDIIYERKNEIHNVNSKISLILADEMGKISYFTYVDCTSSGMFIYDGSVRKAIHKFGSYEVNDKVKINKTRNPLFRKSDVFYIAAFVENIHSQNKPDILLSNYTLVSYDEFENSYSIIKKSDKKYDKLKLSKPDKIKDQSGDSFIIYKINEITPMQECSLYFYNFKNARCNEISINNLNISSYYYERSWYEKNRVKRCGFIRERLSKSEITNLIDNGKLVHGINDNYDGISDHKIKTSLDSAKLLMRK